MEFKECWEDEGTLGSGSSARLDRRAFGDETRDAARRGNATGWSFFDGNNGEKGTTQCFVREGLAVLFPEENLRHPLGRFIEIHVSALAARIASDICVERKCVAMPEVEDDIAIGAFFHVGIEFIWALTLLPDCQAYCLRDGGLRGGGLCEFVESGKGGQTVLVASEGASNSKPGDQQIEPHVMPSA
jgi:hypothetical protein